uniref:BESS domain-containing protein n=1 Tax=Schistosoma curassoni TaxID=6186 RepID=A0A183L0I9_9TREM
LSQNEDEEDEDEEKDGDEDDDDQFFVPHGYLSDDEGVAAEESEGPIPDEMKQLRQRLSVADSNATTNNTTSAVTNNNNHFEENKENIELPERFILNIVATTTTSRRPKKSVPEEGYFILMKFRCNAKISYM